MSNDRAAQLVATELVTGYARARGAARVVTRTSFTVGVGTVVAVVGPNGAGKTTLLKTLVGLLRPLAGRVQFDGVDVDAYRRSSGIGYLPETLALTEHWSGRGLLALAALASRSVAAGAVDDALELAGVDFDIAMPVAEMSKGMRQRLALALVLLPLPSLLLLDEPEAGLDPAQRVLLRQRIQRFVRAGRIVIVASHDVSGICSMADEILFMSGEQLLPVAPDELSDPERLIRLFAGGAA